MRELHRRLYPASARKDDFCRIDLFPERSGLVVAVYPPSPARKPPAGAVAVDPDMFFWLKEEQAAMRNRVPETPMPRDIADFVDRMARANAPNLPRPATPLPRPGGP